MRGQVDLFDAVLGRICLERGWVSRDLLSAALKERETGARRLADVLVERGHLKAAEGQAISREVAGLLEGRSAYTLPARDAGLLGELLQRSGAVTAGQVAEALVLQERAARAGGPVPKLGEILLERRYVTPRKLEKALDDQRARLPLGCSTCGGSYSVAGYDPEKKYLCTKCAGILLPPGAPPPSVPQEVTRAAANIENVLGKFILIEKLGSGGMCTVYKAWDRDSERLVALKILKDRPEAEDLVRFRREAMIAAELRHPNIARIFEVDDLGDRHVIALEYVDGSDLYHRRLSPERAAEVLAAAARAVHYAHEQSVLHRDLTPGNILVDRQGKPFVTDFGMARLLWTQSSITVAGTVMGTPEFMSPEQAMGKISQIDRASEVYSLGAILYYVATGQPPAKGSTLMETLILIEEGAIEPPSRMEPGLPSEFEAILLRALARQKEDRFASAEHLAEALERFLAGRPGRT